MSLQKLKNVYFLGSLVKNIKGIYDKVNEIIDYLNRTTPDVKRYKALLTQSGTNNPTIIVLENTFSSLPIFERIDLGTYKITFTNQLTMDKTAISFGVLDYSLIATSASIASIPEDRSIDLYFFRTFNESGESDGMLNQTLITIEVYP